MANASPIADLSYRNYDGPLDSPEFRWWVIAKMGIRRAIKNRWYWVVMLLSGGYYAVMITILFIVEQLAATSRMGGAEFKSFLSRIVWQDQFLHGFSYGQIWFLIIALMLGSGAIANDNRANALLVYLSKPCTKLDYLIGKWMGIYIPMVAVMLIPALVFYGFGLMSYRDSGFFSSDRLLIFRILMLVPIAAAFETSLILAVSSLFRQGQIAGASYAAMYFISYLFTQMMAFAWAVTQADQAAGVARTWTSYLYYGSIDGVQIGLAKALLHSTGTLPFGMPNQGQHTVPAPSLAIVLLVVVCVSALSLFVAWKRIHAVEVVR